VRRLTLALLTSLTISCGGSVPEPATPQYERSYYKPLEVPPEMFASMDLPYYGGKVERATDSYMQLSYGREATVEQLKEWWPAAVKAEGWVPTREEANPAGGFSGLYTTADGRNGSLSISPTGTLWMVDLTLR